MIHSIAYAEREDLMGSFAGRHGVVGADACVQVIAQMRKLIDRCRVGRQVEAVVEAPHAFAVRHGREPDQGVVRMEEDLVQADPPGDGHFAQRRHDAQGQLAAMTLAGDEVDVAQQRVHEKSAKVIWPIIAFDLFTQWGTDGRVTGGKISPCSLLQLRRPKSDSSICGCTANTRSPTA